MQYNFSSVLCIVSAESEPKRQQKKKGSWKKIRGKTQEEKFNRKKLDVMLRMNTQTKVNTEYEV